MPAFSFADFLASIPLFVVTCPGEVLGAGVALVGILALRQFGTSSDDDHGTR